MKTIVFALIALCISPRRHAAIANAPSLEALCRTAQLTLDNLRILSAGSFNCAGGNSRHR
jgi:hypothetical protein